MQKIKLIFIFWAAGILFPVSAQIGKIAEGLFKKVDSITLQNKAPDQAADVSVDTAQIEDLKRQLELSKQSANELRMAMEQMQLLTYGADSIKKARAQQKIDSLRLRTKGVPVIVNDDTLFVVYANRGGLTPMDRAASYVERIEALGKRFDLKPDSVYLDSTDVVTDIMYKGKVLVSCTDQDAIWRNMSREALVEKDREVIISQLKILHKEYGLAQLLKRWAYFLAVILLQIALWWAITYFYKYVKKRISMLKETKLKPFAIQNYNLLDTEKQEKLLIFLASIGRYTLITIQLFFTVPLLFAIFPQTENLAIKIFSYIWNPMKGILHAALSYIPDMFTILVIIVVMRYLIKGLSYLASEVESGNLKITGFYADWAAPTFHLVRFMLYAFTIAMIYPYLPGSKSGAFQGISVFIGLVISLGSSTVIGNIMAGMVLTYMRSFKIGDRIKLDKDGMLGNVVEKTLFVTRIRTPKNEIITIPNAAIMSSNITNYSSSAREHSLLLHTEVTIGYDVPWRKIHELLISAALATPGVISKPTPFVLETSLSDFYPVYQINACIADVDNTAKIYAALHQNILDKFNEAGVEIMSPHYTAFRNGNESTIPKAE